MRSAGIGALVLVALGVSAAVRAAAVGSSVLVPAAWGGTEGCRGVPDGTPCDDGNACTPASACSRGVCEGVRFSDSLSAGFFHTCAVRQDGRLACWGAVDRDFGQVGGPNASDVRHRAVASGIYHTCALQENRHLA